MTDMAGEAVYVRREPRDRFETELYRQYIQEQISRWYTSNDISVSISEEHDDGVWTLYIQWDEPLDPLDLFPNSIVTGKVWLAEMRYPVTEYYRVRVMHEVDGTVNTGFPPILPEE